MLTLAHIAGSEASLLAGVVQNLPPQLQKTIDANTLRTQAAQAVALALDGIDLNEAAKAGIVNRRLALTVAGVGLRNTPDSDTSVNSYLGAVAGSEWQDTEGALDLMNNTKTQTNVRASKADKARVNAIAVNLLDNIKDEITPLEAQYLTEMPDGSYQIIVPDDPAIRVKVGRFSLYTNKVLKNITILFSIIMMY